MIIIFSIVTSEDLPHEGKDIYWNRKEELHLVGVFGTCWPAGTLLPGNTGSACFALVIL